MRHQLSIIIIGISDTRCISTSSKLALRFFVYILYFIIHYTSIKIISNETVHVSMDSGAKSTQTRIVVGSSSIKMIIQGAPYMFSQ